MKVIIFGASGRTGTELVKQALSRGHCVTAYARKQQFSLKGIQDRKLILVEGELNDFDQVCSAIRGKDAVISALGVSKTLRHDPAVVSGVATIIRAMKAEQVDRMIYLSVFLAWEGYRQFSFFARNILRKILICEVSDHEAKEKLIREGVKTYTLVRATRLTDKPLTEEYRHGASIPIKNFVPSISRADVAHFMLNQLTDKIYQGQAPLLTGHS